MEGNFSTRLFARRNALGLTQGGLAELAGVAISSVSAWERGVNPPTGRTLEKLSEKLRVSVAWLLGGSHEAEAAHQQAAELHESPDPIVPPFARGLVERLVMIPTHLRAEAVDYLERAALQFLAQKLALPAPVQPVAAPRLASREPTDLDVAKVAQVVESVRQAELSPSVGAQTGKTGAQRGGIPQVSPARTAAPAAATGGSKSSRAVA
jgi:transcriptional regulator with XRE-family HTH domain